jgi:hypothetical protein
MSCLIRVCCSILCIVDQFTELCEAELFLQRFRLSVGYQQERGAQWKMAYRVQKIPCLVLSTRRISDRSFGWFVIAVKCCL